MNFKVILMQLTVCNKLQFYDMAEFPSKDRLSEVCTCSEKYFILVSVYIRILLQLKFFYQGNLVFKHNYTKNSQSYYQNTYS